jgi:hypothetical protein
MMTIQLIVTLILSCLVTINARLLAFDSFDYGDGVGGSGGFANNGIGFASGWQVETGDGQVTWQSASSTSDLSWNGLLNGLNSTGGRMSSLGGSASIYRTLGSAVKTEILDSGVVWLSVLVRCSTAKPGDASFGVALGQDRIDGANVSRTLRNQDGTMKDALGAIDRRGLFGARQLARSAVPKQRAPGRQ